MTTTLIGTPDPNECGHAPTHQLDIRCTLPTGHHGAHIDTRGPHVSSWPTDYTAPDAGVALGQMGAYLAEMRQLLRPDPPLDRQIVIRITPAMHDLLEQDALDNERTISGSIRYHLRQALGINP